MSQIATIALDSPLISIATCDKPYWERFAVAIVIEGEVPVKVVSRGLTFQEAERLANRLEAFSPLQNGRSYQIVPPGTRAG